MRAKNRILKGIPASPGIVIGRARVLNDLGNFRASYRLVYTEEEKAAEVERFESAVDQAHKDLTRLKERLQAEFPEHTHLLELHLLILKDQMLYDEPLRLIKEKNLNAEWALYQAFDRVRELFSHIEDPYIKGRIQDVESVYRRLLGILSGKCPGRDFHPPEPLILVAKDLSPAETSQMAGSKVLGFITERGGKTSHTAILAQSLEIPAVVGLDRATQEIAPGDELILDGLTGRVILSPSEGLVRKYRVRKKEFEAFKATVARNSAAPAVTPDGFLIRVLANLELPEEVQLAQKYGADGVGLYRTEFLYLRQRHLPTEDELFEDYRRVVEAMRPHQVTIRTLDIGGDKFMPRLEYAPEMNPALGLRAIRFCLKEQKIFRTQLRAILRASAFGQVRVMFPLISSVQEMRAARQLLQEVQAELNGEGVPFDPNLPVGAMIEVPAAVTLSRVLAREADFFSIGTNDLIQYALAIDRGNKMVASMYQPLHPAVMHMIRQVVAAGQEADIPVAMCGEMAGDPLHIPILLGLGVRELSMNPMAIPVIKSVIRQLSLTEAQEMAAKALNMVTVEEINDFASQEMGRRFPEIFRFGSALAGVP
jgi:phosphotransferase system enzyme I (PtsI)|uniref:Phosphoenolpyruvate-protein phosphotransferase n=1 Tax=Desulfobacca acetoxidans TaxID=60893 RepID=A0A7C3SKU5_9BACT